MPQKKSKETQPPEVMTWGRASIVLIIAVVFDLLRLFFQMFWFFGPALAAALCTIKTGAVVGTTIGGLACGAAAASVGALAFEVIETFGVVMAIAIGVFGWLVVFFLLTAINARIFKTLATSWLWSLFGLGVSIIPIVGSIPMITISVLRLYHAQIKKDREKLKEWQTMHKDMQTKIMRAAQTAEFVRQQQGEEIPQEMREAA